MARKTRTRRARKPARTKTRTRTLVRYRTRRAPTKRRATRRRTSRAAPIYAAVKTAAGIALGIVAAGALARVRVLDTPLKRALVVGGSGLGLALAGRRLPLIPAGLARTLGVGMVAGASLSLAPTAAARLNAATTRAQAAGLLAGGPTRRAVRPLSYVERLAAQTQ